MTKDNFPYIAGVLGIVLTIIVFKGSVLRDDGRTMLPLLTLLVVCEFGAIVTAIGTYVGIKDLFSTRKFTKATAVSLLCLFMSLHFILGGIELWPN